MAKRRTKTTRKPRVAPAGNATTTKKPTRATKPTTTKPTTTVPTAPVSTATGHTPTSARRRSPASARPHDDPKVMSDSLTRTLRARQLFWNNVIREMLCSLAMIAEKTADRTTSNPRRAPDITAHAGTIVPKSEDSPDLSHASIFDGRLGIILSSGNRIPIADIRPVFAVGVTKTARDRWLSETVECTVFEITTPDGEVLTIPLHEIRAFHSLNEELLKRLQDASREGATPEDAEQPFGFAAFTSLARSRDPEEPTAELADVPRFDPGWQGE